MSSKVDPTDWANKRKAAMERANQLKEERKRGISSGDQNQPQPTFQPQINKRPSYLDNAAKKAEPEPYRPPADPIFEVPLPGRKAYSIPSDNGGGQPLSPGSDALGKELKRVTGSTAAPPASIRSGGRGVPLGELVGNSQYQQPSQQQQPQQGSQFKSKFMQQYDVNAQQQQAQDQGPSRNRAAQAKAAAAEADETFMNQLRGGGGGGGWNDDTTTGGTFDSIAKKPAARRKPNTSQPSAGGIDLSRDVPISAYLPAQQPNRGGVQNSPRGNFGGNDEGIAVNQQQLKVNSRRAQQQQQSQMGYEQQQDPYEARRSPRGAPPVAPIEAKSRLSLLKSKMRKSEGGGPVASAGAANSMAGNQNDYLLRSSSAEQDYSMDNGGLGDYRPPMPKSAHANLQRSGPQYQQQPSQQQPPRQQQFQYSDPFAEQDMGGDVVVRKGGRRAGQPLAAAAQNSYDGGYDDAPVARNRVAPANNYQSHQQSAAQSYDPVSNLAGGREGVRQIKQTAPPAQKPSAASNGYDDDDFEDDGGYGSQGNADAFDADAFGAEEEGERMKCPDCPRWFNPVAYAKHVKICAKVFQKKRKVFDSAKMRIEDNEELVKILEQKKKEEKRAAMAAKRAGAKATAVEDKPIQPDNSVPKWKNDSQAFREAMKAARQLKQAMATGAPLPPPVISGPDPSLIPCPHCNRRFNQKAADRHIPQCQNIIAKPTSLKMKSGGAGGIAGSLAAKNKGGNSKAGRF